jgi:hypothetical protein
MENKLQEYFDLVMTYKMRSNVHRYNVSGIKEIRQYGRHIGSDKWVKVGHPIKSQNFGLVRKFKLAGLHPSNYNTKHPHIYEALKQIINILDPTFEYDGITVNKNVLARPHRDTNNVGISLIIGFGNYSGGGLYVEENDGNFKLHDINHKPLYFNGSTQTHYTEQFEGTRWTVIYYKLKKHKRIVD